MILMGFWHIPLEQLLESKGEGIPMDYLDCTSIFSLCFYMRLRVPRWKKPTAVVVMALAAP
jgi:hypothetical protein